MYDICHEEESVKRGEKDTGTFVDPVILWRARFSFRRFPGLAQVQHLRGGIDFKNQLLWSVLNLNWFILLLFLEAVETI